MGRFMCILIILMVLATMNGLEARSKISAARCKKERRLLINACKPVLYGSIPSAECCRLLRTTHLKCICPVITPKLAALIDVNRAIRLVEGCGRRVPRHYKCGSITTP